MRTRKCDVLILGGGQIRDTVYAFPTFSADIKSLL
jgi:hypothetical protein